MNPASDETDRLYTTTEVLDLFAPNLTIHQLHRWIHRQAITLAGTPPKPGSGTPHHWSLHEACTLALIAQLRDDLDDLGLPMSIVLVARCWRAFAHNQPVVVGRVTLQPLLDPR